MTLSIILAMAWKSAVISGAALLLVAMLRKRAAADRAALLLVGVVLLLMLPLISAALPALTIETAPRSAASEALSMPVQTAGHLTALASAPVAEGTWLAERTDLVAGLAYLAGLLLIAGRFAFGLRTLRRWTRDGRPVTSGPWAAALERHAPLVRARPLLIESAHVDSPISWGLRRPVVLLDPQCLQRPEDADAVLAHEMAHVARLDWLSLLLARTAVALFWFNPLVWLLEREIVQQAEEAADSHALERVEAIRYAETLLTCAQRCSGSRIPANSIAGSGGRLARRVKAVLNGEGRAAAGSRWTLAAIAGCIAVGGPVAAMQLVESAPETSGARVIYPTPFAAPRSAQARAAMPQAAGPALPPAAPAPIPAALPLPAASAAANAFALAPAPAPAPAVHPKVSGPDGDGFRIEIDEVAIERAVEAAHEAAAHASVAAERIAARASAEAIRTAVDSDRIAAVAIRSARAGHSAAADGMLRGADSLEEGARQMDRTAINLGKRDYREREIARAAAKGQRVTHESLLEAIPELRQGARDMREGARELRAGAAEMRRSGI